MAISERFGGIPSLTAIVVIAIGIIGGIAGPWVLRVLKVDSKIAIGLALGASAHGLGTARAMELGAIEGAIGGLAIGIMGLMTALIAPFFLT
jgi:putative effector of murein hydrolase